MLNAAKACVTYRLDGSKPSFHLHVAQQGWKHQRARGVSTFQNGREQYTKTWSYWNVFVNSEECKALLSIDIFLTFQTITYISIASLPPFFFFSFPTPYPPFLCLPHLHWLPLTHIFIIEYQTRQVLWPAILFLVVSLTLERGFHFFGLCGF